MGHDTHTEIWGREAEIGDLIYFPKAHPSHPPSLRGHAGERGRVVDDERPIRDRVGVGFESDWMEGPRRYVTVYRVAPKWLKVLADV